MTILYSIVATPGHLPRRKPTWVFQSGGSFKASRLRLTMYPCSIHRGIFGYVYNVDWPAFLEFFPHFFTDLDLVLMTLSISCREFITQALHDGENIFPICNSAVTGMALSFSHSKSTLASKAPRKPF
jgi:hypothetical protein